MKCIITILQHKRVALPYIFHRHCLPMFRQRFRGDIELCHIFHDLDTSSNLASSRDLGADALEQVRQFIYRDHYPEATILRHTTTCNTLPSLPSYRMAAQLMLSRGADFHLWLEDDAIVYDEGCRNWAITLGSGDVGLYQDTTANQIINTAYFLSTPEFDRRFIQLLDEYDNDVMPAGDTGMWERFVGKGSMIEHLAWRAARKSVYMGPDKVFRHHPYQKHKKTREMVKDWLLRKVPGVTPLELDLLALDFQD